MTTADRLIALAGGDIGYSECQGHRHQAKNHTKFGDWYGLDGQPWCAMAVSKWFFDIGVPLPASTPKGFAYTPAGASWFQKQGRWTSTPERGHVVFFDFPGDSTNRISHVGIVETVNGDGTIGTIEGNTSPPGGGSDREGGSVCRRRRNQGIVGYGIPTWPTAQPAPAAPALWEQVAFGGFSGGVSVASGDVDGDGQPEIMVAAGPGGGPHVRVLKADGTEVTAFMAFDPNFPGGVFVAAGDVDGDGRAEIVCGAGPGGGPHVRVFRFDGKNVTEAAGFFAYRGDMNLGVRVAVGPGWIATGVGPGGGAHVRLLRWQDITG